jgi:NAD(P)-dependent dehydrogenase (short-subunit alcohol dehydrogenase family)
MGEGIARLFSAEGCAVVISGRDESKSRNVSESINAGGGRSIFMRADVSVETDCRALIDRTVETYGQIDILVNNVGLSTRGTIEDTTVELWDKLFATNVRSAFVCMQQAVRYMKEKRGGSIINIGSVNAYIGEPKLMAYSATKGALMTLTRNTASYLNQYRIRVNQLNVGWTETPNEHRVKLEEESKGADWLEEAVKTRPFGRLLQPLDIARAALYFASDDSECVTGSVLDIEQYPVGAPPNW